jgi:predicted nuclease of restriction endonuclease-like RecB superfamily
MRFGLQDVKKTVYRRGGDLFVTLHFLSPGELQQEIGQLIAYHERLLGQPRRQFSPDEACSSIGDYRLAQCLLSTLSYWYHWQGRDWHEVLGMLDASGVAGYLLLEAEISTPSALRLALYDFVNQYYHGFLSSEQRDEALSAFASHYALTQADLEYLLALDSEEEALLTRATTIPPTPQEVALLYNQWAFEAALTQSSSVRFVIDSAAFSHLNSQQSVGTGVGAAIKRLCFLARKIGVYYDLTYEGENAVSPLQNDIPSIPRLVLTLYGPQEVTGAAQQYGLRLARLCRLLLGYERVGGNERREHGHKRIGRATLGRVIVSAEATVHFLQRAYTLAMDAQLLTFLQVETLSDAAEGVQPENNSASAGSTTVFDSSIEQSFAETFGALARVRGEENTASMHGWQLEREPEPLLLQQGIFIPDFALTRPPYRIYVEILGFWTPAYRERKIQKLRQLEGRDDILLAVPREAQAAFAALSAYFPIIVYDQQLSITDLLHVLETRYDDSAARLAQIDVAAVRALIEEHGWLGERESYTLLHCYRSIELQQAADSIVNDQIGFMVGVGFYSRSWLEQLHQETVLWLRQQASEAGRQTLPLSEVLQTMRAYHPQLATCEDIALELLLGSWSEVQIQRTSIFDVAVQIITERPSDEIKKESLHVDEHAETSWHALTKQATRTVRERRPGPRKRGENTVKQQPNLWENVL